MTPEGKVKAKARSVIHSLGFYTFPVNQRGIGRRGIPDDFLLLYGVPFFIEYKAHMRWDTNKKVALATLPTMLQVSEMQDIRANGGRTLVVDDAGLDVLIEWLHSCKKDEQARSCYGLSWNITKEKFDAYAKAHEDTARAMLGFFTYNDERLIVPFIK